MRTITKKDMATTIAGRTGLTQADVKEVIGAFLDEIKTQFNKRNQITLRGFGTFMPHYRKARKYKDPTSGEEGVMDARYTLRFKTSKNLFIFKKGEK